MTATATAEATIASGAITYRIYEGNYEALKARVAKLAKRAARLGSEPIVLTVVGEDVERHTRLDPITGMERVIVHRFLICTLSGSAPSYNGWTFAASLQHSDEGNILATSPEFTATIPPHFRNARPACENCTGNRHWKDTYVLYHAASNVWKQVGRNCLRDFLGHSDPHRLAELAEIIFSLGRLCADAEEYDGFGRERASNWDVENFLGLVAGYIRVHGWLSATKAREISEATQRPVTSTVQSILWFLDLARGDGRHAREAREELQKIQPTDADKADVAAAIEWAQNLDVTDGADYLWNIRTIALRGWCEPRQLGITGSIVAAWKRATRDAAERAARPVSHHVGTIGERSEFTLTLVHAIEVESIYGLLVIALFTDENGNKIVWKTHTRPDIDRGATRRAKATVAAHDVYKGEAQTAVKRVKFVD